MHVIHEIAGIDGDIWTLEHDEDELYLTHVFSDHGESVRSTVPVDMYVLAAMAKASRPAAVVLAPLQHPEWRTLQ